MSHNFSMLEYAVREASVNGEKPWNLVCAEWRPYSIHHVPLSDGVHCECGVHIANVHTILNQYNGNELIIGCVCIRHFQSNLNFDLIEKALLKGQFNLSTVKYVESIYPNIYKTERERNFIYNIINARSFSEKSINRLSEKQLKWYKDIKRRVLSALKRHYVTTDLGNNQ